MRAAEVAAALRTVYDPELGIDIVSLGLVYHIEAGETGIRVDLAMTTPHCPMAGVIFSAVDAVLGETFPGVPSWLALADEPPWSVHMADPAALRRLGLIPT